MANIFDRILTLNLVANTAIFCIAARLYLVPLLPRLRPRQVLIPILLLHSMRHLGMMFLTRGATYPGLSAGFLCPALFGVLLPAALSLISLPLVMRRSPLSKSIVWVFNVFGTIDLLCA